MSNKLGTWMPLYWGDYWKDTANLSCAQHGAYLNLLGECWVRGGLLPNDDDELWRLARADGLKHWQTIKDKVIRLFNLTDAGYRHKRVEHELIRQGRFQRIQSEKGKKGAEAAWKNRRGGRGSGGGNTPPMAASMAGSMPGPSSGMAGAMAQALPGHWPGDAKPKPNISPLPPKPSAEPERRPPAVRVTASGGLAMNLKPMPTDRPMSPSEFEAQKAQRLQEFADYEAQRQATAKTDEPAV